MSDITAIILTKNEEKNIRACIESIKDLVCRIIVVDSYSDDNTVQIAREYGAEVIQNKWINYATQFQYGIDNGEIKTKWIIRIDADERLTEKSRNEIKNLCIENEDTDVNGIIVRFEVTFLGKKLRHGGIYPIKVLRVFKNGIGKIENRNMDEHIILESGRSVIIKNDCLHCDYKNISSWIDKHNKYSSREAIDYFEKNLDSEEKNKLVFSAKIKRYIKYNIYYKLPMGMRAHLYYWYRYYIRLGFLDGKEGKIFNFLQAYWYRFLVDAKIFEKKKEPSDKEV